MLVYRSKSLEPVTFNISPGGPGSSGSVGSLGGFDPNYLVNPNPSSGNVLTLPVNAPASGPDAAGVYTFLALLWAPDAMPVHGVFPVIDLAATATQGQMAPAQASIQIQPPPLLLVHGIWSDAEAAGFSMGSGGFYDWIADRYPNSPIVPVDYGNRAYGNLSSQGFDNPETQTVFLTSLTNALGKAAGAGMAARTVDVVAHSMGGLVTRYFMTKGPASPSPQLLPNSVHKLITVGTPHQGTELATVLLGNKNLVSPFTLTINPLVAYLCVSFSSCTLGDIFGIIGKPIDSGVQSLEPESPQLESLSSQNTFSAIVGTAPQLSVTKLALNILISAFLPGESVDSILDNQPNDTIVPTASQNPGPPSVERVATISGIVHTNLCQDIPSVLLNCPDTGETQSQDVWQQALFWLTGGPGNVPAGVTSNAIPKTSAEDSTTTPAPVLDLTGYTQVPASNVTSLPATGSTLAINSATNITAASSTKTITEILLLQTVMDPSDTVLLYSTQAPFSIPFTPTRLGSASFTAITVFSDNTFAVTTLDYTFQTSGAPTALNLVNAPVADMALGSLQAVA